MPRGFSRHYVVGLLAEGPRTGKEIIDCAAERSGGMWRPSPGLVYPLLGRLLGEGLVEEEGGRYSLTELGRATAADVDRVREIVGRQLDVLLRLGGAGRFVAADALERAAAAWHELGARAEGPGGAGYRRFLESELARLGPEKD